MKVSNLHARRNRLVTHILAVNLVPANYEGPPNRIELRVAVHCNGHSEKPTHHTPKEIYTMPNPSHSSETLEVPGTD